MKILQQELSTAFVSGTRSGNNKMVYRNFEVRKLIWGRNPNVEPVPLGTVSILEDLASLIKD